MAKRFDVHRFGSYSDLGSAAVRLALEDGKQSVSWICPGAAQQVVAAGRTVESFVVACFICGRCLFQFRSLFQPCGG